MKWLLALSYGVFLPASAFALAFSLFAAMIFSL